jgi:hypothetical protein
MDRATERGLAREQALRGAAEVQLRGDDQEGAHLAHVEFRQAGGARGIVGHVLSRIASMDRIGRARLGADKLAA